MLLRILRGDYPEFFGWPYVTTRVLIREREQEDQNQRRRGEQKQRKQRLE